MTILKLIIGIVGENAGDMIDNSKKYMIKQKQRIIDMLYKIKRQTSLQVMYILNHFDNNENLALDEIELKYAKQSITNILPDLNLDDVTSQVKDIEIKLDALLSIF